METEIANHYKHNIHKINRHIIQGSNKYKESECWKGERMNTIDGNNREREERKI